VQRDAVAAERLQKVARGESEANTPRTWSARNSCRVSGTGKMWPPSGAADAAQLFILDSRSRGARDETARTPRYLL